MGRKGISARRSLADREVPMSEETRSFALSFIMSTQEQQVQEQTKEEEGEVQIRLVENPSPDELKRIIDVLLSSFDGDIGLQSLTLGDKVIEELMYNLTLQQALRNGLCYVAEHQGSRSICGVSVWTAPGNLWKIHTDPEFTKQLPHDLREWYENHYSVKYEELYSMGFSSPFSSSASSSSLKNQNGFPRNHVWTLKLIAVVPEARRKGIGKSLINVCCKEVDRYTQWVATDVTDPNIVNFLQQFGFQYCAVKNISSSTTPGFPIWCMIREPPQAPSHS
ncbi:hypothetical protein ABKN59_004360 [Abortiporus biennis]